MTSPANSYPLVTQAGQAIPLEVIRPDALAILEVAGYLTAPASATLMAIHAVGAEGFVRFGNAFPSGNLPAAGIVYSQGVYIPKDSVVVIQLLADLVYGIPAAGGKLVFQFIEPWAGLGLENQYRRK